MSSSCMLRKQTAGLVLYQNNENHLRFEVVRVDGEVCFVVTSCIHGDEQTLATTRLEKKGLVEGFTDPRDRRIKHVRLTESGAEMRQTCHKDILQSEKRMSAGMTEEEKQLFLQCLQKVYENLKDDMNETEHCHNNYNNNEGKE